MKNRLFPLIVLIFFGFCSCNSSATNKSQLKIAATAIPHAEMLEAIRKDIEEEGYELQILTITDYNLPNRMLAEKEISANFFQHIPFLEDQIKRFNYPITCYVKVHIEPLGFYSKKIQEISSLKDKSLIAIPSDPTNEARALLLLQKQGLIQLKDPNNFLSTPQDIISNPHHFSFKEIDASILARTLVDVDGAIIPTNFALQAHLNPLKDALFIEDADSPYVNVIAICKTEGQQKDLLVLKKWMNSEKMRAFILEKYQGALVPAFGDCSNP